MTKMHLMAMLPFVILAGGALLILVGVAIRRSHLVSNILLVGATLGALVTLPDPSRVEHLIPLLQLDHFALFFIALISVATCAIGQMAYVYLEHHHQRNEELYLLLLLAALGASVMVAASHIATFFIGLELLSVSLYTLVAYLPDQQRSVEAGVKYLVLAAASSAFLAFGLALIYARLGSMEFSDLASRLVRTDFDALLYAGLALVVVGMGFKLAVVPFHLWTPDVYQGAPTPVTAFVATVSKGAVVAVLLRFSIQLGLANHAFWVNAFTVFAIASMLIGNLLALRQKSIKRILAYSSIAHLGYVLVAVLAGGPRSTAAAVFYMVAYFVTTLGAFGIVGLMARDGLDRDDMRYYRGLGRDRPGLAAVLTVMLLSLAGIPLTAGFMGKYLVLTSGVGAAKWVLVFTLVVSSLIGLAYYLRVVVVMFMTARDDEGEEQGTPARVPLVAIATMGVLVGALVWLGVYPETMLSWVVAATQGWF